MAHRFDPHKLLEDARVAFTPKTDRPASLIPGGRAKHDKEARKRRRGKGADAQRLKVSFFRYAYYAPVFKYFIEQVLECEYLPLPDATKRTSDLGERNSSDYVCTPFKHLLGDYIEALELGADAVIQFGGPCRLGYYGELQESILRDMGYDFQMVNFAVADPDENYALACVKEGLRLNPDINVPRATTKFVTVIEMLCRIDDAYDYLLANAAFEREPGAFDRAWSHLAEALLAARNQSEVHRAFKDGMAQMQAIELDKPKDPIRIGVVGEMFTAMDARSNFNLDRKLQQLGAEVHRMMNLSNRLIRVREPALRKTAQDYLRYDMGPTSTLTVAGALHYAEAGFDGIVHAKSAGCTPEIDCEPVLQRIGADKRIPILYLTYDSQSSDTGLDTRLEAFTDMLVMKKAKDA